MTSGESSTAGRATAAAGRNAPTLPIAIAAVLAAIAALLYALRGAPLGVPVADDYSFLARLRFQHPLDPFDSMGATYYWRPLARQLYFSLLAGTWFAAPWVAAALHLGLLAATFVALFVLLRRAFSPWTAAAIAVFPLLAEPGRALIAWPSGIQHLLAGALTAAAIAAAAGGRLVPAALAAFAGLLSHESAWIAVAALPVAGWLRTRDSRRTLPWALAAVAIATTWGIGYRVALAHGVALPPGLASAFAIERLAALTGLAASATMNLEDLAPPVRTALLAAHATLALMALALLLRPTTRARLHALRLPIALGFAAYVVGALPLAVLLPDWNAWRAWMPALALGVAWGALLACAAPWLAAAFVALRLAALLFAPPAPSVVSRVPPDTASHMSFVRLARLQRTVESARGALLASHPTLPRGATVLFWEIPRLAEVAFQDQTAARTWYRDSTLTWDSFGGAAGFQRPAAAVVEFVTGRADPAQIVPPEAIAHFGRAIALLQRQELARADAEFVASIAANGARPGSLRPIALNNRARIAAALGHLDRADSLNRLSFEGGGKAGYWAFAARLALARGDRAGAMEAVRAALTIDPENEEAAMVVKELETR